VSLDEVVHISHDELYQPVVDSTLAHQKALVRQSQPIVEQPASPLRRLLLSNFIYTPLAGLLGALTTWLILEPSIDETAGADVATVLLFPMTATFIVLFIFISEAISSRRLRGNLGRWSRGAGFTLLFSFLAYIPAGLLVGILVLLYRALFNPMSDSMANDLTAWPVSFFLMFVIWRSLSFAVFGVALGLGMNLMRCPSAQRRASVMGGVVGGALGGLCFDPINRFLFPLVEQAAIMRGVSLGVIGLCVGIFIALSESLGREGWVRVQTGPLRGKAFILYHNPTIIGSSPQATIYLFKDTKVAPQHAALHRVGSGYELVEISSDAPISINNTPVRRRRLMSGDQIIIGDTILDFEERAKRKSISDNVIRETRI
jgi:hypothetical protein